MRLPIYHHGGCGQVGIILVRDVREGDVMRASDFELPSGRKPAAGDPITCDHCHQGMTAEEVNIGIRSARRTAATS